MRKGGMMAMFAMAAVTGMGMTDYGTHKPETAKPLTPEDIERLYALRRELMKRKGLREFTVGDFTVMALNEKNAVRKIEKFKKQLEDYEREQGEQT